jgi:amino acid transporter
VFGLLFIILCSGYCCVLGTVLTNSRTYWALARDNAVPLSAIFGKVNEGLSCPVYSTLFVGRLAQLSRVQPCKGRYLTGVITAAVATGILAIPLGSATGFLAITGSFIVLTTVSYGKI